MSHIFARNSRHIPPQISHGDGAYLYDRDGKAYLDGSGGAAVSCLGHSDAAVAQAIREQLGQVAFAHTGFFTSQPAEDLAERLVHLAPEGIDQVYLVSGGSEAVESALKLARQYYVELGQPQRRHVIARRQSYHGNTLGALAVGGNAWRRAQFDPMLIETHHVAPCYAYRDQRADETPQAYGLRLAAELEAKIHELGPETVMGFIAEPVVGATAGALAPVPGYFKALREICDRHGILLILDEVMCGMGRTGTLFACEQDQVRPDILAVAKGLGAGYQPVGAMLCSAQIHDTIAAGSGFFQHGHTYNGHPIAAAAANAVLSRLSDDGLVTRAADIGAKLRAALEDQFGQHPHIGDIRGRGMFLGLELVADRGSKTPFPSETNLAPRLKAAAFEAGLICYPMGGTIDGKQGAHVLLAPPFILSEAQIGELTEKLARALEAVL
ncbi:MAG: aspartate aminotransferase family protein [Mangrovicoccus sp.]|nr:aspartate aminotransferase family protein [Mangrovicoccus sp.]